MRRAGTTGEHGEKNPDHDYYTGHHVNLFDPLSQTWACLTCNEWHYPDCGCELCVKRALRPADREFTAPHTFQHAQARPTEQAAAAAALPGSGAGRLRVFEWLAGLRDTGATDHELVAALGMNPSTVRPRRLELVEAGVVVDSGRTRPTESGRQAVVWIVSNVEPSGNLDSSTSRGEVQTPGPMPGEQETPAVPPTQERML